MKLSKCAFLVKFRNMLVIVILCKNAITEIMPEPPLSSQKNSVAYIT